MNPRRILGFAAGASLMTLVLAALLSTPATTPMQRVTVYLVSGDSVVVAGVDYLTTAEEDGGFVNVRSPKVSRSFPVGAVREVRSDFYTLPRR